MHVQVSAQDYRKHEYEIYQETREIKLGKLNKNPLLEDLADWFKEHYKVNVLNFRFDTLCFSKRKKFRLYVILDKHRDYQKMFPNLYHENEMDQVQIVSKFRELAQKHRFPIDKRIKNIFVAFYNFSQEARSEANGKVVKEFSERIKAEYPTVWEIYGAFDSLIVFYFSDNEVKENRNNGINDTIENRYYETLKRYDEMNYFTRANLEIKFDSKENLDKNFDGNFYYYIH